MTILTYSCYSFCRYFDVYLIQIEKQILISIFVFKVLSVRFYDKRQNILVTVGKAHMNIWSIEGLVWIKKKFGVLGGIEEFLEARPGVEILDYISKAFHGLLCKNVCITFPF